MHNTHLNSKTKLQIMEIGASEVGIRTLELAFILATIIDKELAKTKASFLTDWNTCLYYTPLSHSYSIC